MSDIEGEGQRRDEEMPVIRLDHALVNQMTRNGERLAAAEQNISSLKEDSRVIRGALHEVNGKMQLFVVAEQACGKALDSINATLKEHTDTFREQAELLRSLMTYRAQTQGMWMALAKMGLVAVALIAGIAWFVDHYLVVSLK